MYAWFVVCKQTHATFLQQTPTTSQKVAKIETSLGIFKHYVPRVSDKNPQSGKVMTNPNTDPK